MQKNGTPFFTEVEHLHPFLFLFFVFFLFFLRVLSPIRAWSTGGKYGRLSPSHKETSVLQNSHPHIRLLAPTFLSLLLLLGLKCSMTPSLITSACQSNFVSQNRNALFWWDRSRNLSKCASRVKVKVARFYGRLPQTKWNDIRHGEFSPTYQTSIITASLSDPWQ